MEVGSPPAGSPSPSLATTFGAGYAGAASLDLTVHDYGLSLGDSRVTRGIRLNLIDRDLELAQGLNITLWRAGDVREACVDGLALGLVAPEAGRLRGITIGGLGVGAGTIQGLAIGGLGIGSASSPASASAASAWGANP